MADISLQVNNGLFNYKVGAIIINDKKVLMIKNDVFPYGFELIGFNKCAYQLAVGVFSML